MAALVLSVAGSAAGGAAFGSAGAIAGRVIGALAGNVIDRSLFGTNVHRDRSVHGPRLADLSVMASTQGAPIPRVYGRARLSGQVIWATNLEEVVTTTRPPKRPAAAAAARAWAAARASPRRPPRPPIPITPISRSACARGRSARCCASGPTASRSILSGLTLRIYTGDETQTADPLIVAKEGEAPAYRGLAYVVFERLPVADFGNRIPQLSFEVVAAGRSAGTDGARGDADPRHHRVRLRAGDGGAPLGPGQSAPENRHISYAASDVVASLDALQAAVRRAWRTCRVVVAWFGTDLRCGECRVVPSIDNREKATFGGIWSVAGVESRQRAAGVDL